MSHLHQNQTDFDSDSQNQKLKNKNNHFLDQFIFNKNKTTNQLNSKFQDQFGAQHSKNNSIQNKKTVSELKKKPQKINQKPIIFQVKEPNIKNLFQKQKISKFGFQTISFKQHSNNNESRAKYQQEKKLISSRQSDIYSIFDSRSCCKSLVPITFADTLSYQQKTLQLLNLKTFKNKIDIISFISQNNQQNFNIQNCDLLNFIQLDKFWQIIVPKMIHDITEHSQKISAGKLQLSLEGYISSIKINKFYCYILMCQMFFGLIPFNFHNRIHGKITYPTFGKLFQRFKRKQSQQDIDQKQLNNLNKIKCLIFYFTGMVDQQRKVQSKNSSITISRQKYFIQEDLFYNCSNVTSEHNQKFAISEQDYGPLGDQKLSNFKYKIQDKFNYGQTFVRIVQVDTLIDQFQANDQKQKNITTSFYEHPELFILKVVCCQLGKNQCIGIYGCNQFSRCLYDQNFECICSSLTQQEQRKRFSLILVNQPKKRYNIKRYYFNQIKQKLQFYICFLNLASKNQSLTKKNIKMEFIKIPFCLLNHEDPYLDFLVMWMAISLSKLKHHSMLVISLNNGQYEQTPQIYTYKKIMQSLKDQQVGDIMAIIKGYRQYEIKKRFQQRQKAWKIKTMDQTKKKKQLINQTISSQILQLDIKSREYNFEQYLKKVAI